MRKLKTNSVVKLKKNYPLHSNNLDICSSYRCKALSPPRQSSSDCQLHTYIYIHNLYLYMMVLKAVSLWGCEQAFREVQQEKSYRLEYKYIFFKPSGVHALYVNLQKYSLRLYIEGLTFLVTASPSSQLVFWKSHSKKGCRIRSHGIWGMGKPDLLNRLR